LGSSPKGVCDRMDLTELLKLIEEMPAFRRLVTGKDETPVSVLDAAKPYLIAALFREWRQPMLVVTAQPENAKKLYEQVAIWANGLALSKSNGQVKFFPEPDVLPYERITSDVATELERVQVLSALVNCGPGGSSAPLVVTSAPALMGKLPGYPDFAPACHTVRQGMEVEPMDLLGRWERMGYRLESIVEIPGTTSRRGGIVDIYPATSEFPARLEFFGNSIESLRHFDPLSQRSTKTIESIAISPATELLRPLVMGRSDLERLLNGVDLSGTNDEMRQQFRQEIEMIRERQRPPNLQFYSALFNDDTLLSYLPRNALLVLDEPRDIEQSVEEFDAEAVELRSVKLERGELPRNFPQSYFGWNELAPLIDGNKRLALTSWGDDESNKLSFTVAPSYGGQLPQFLKKTKQLLEEKKRLVLVSHQASRLSELLAEQDVIAAPLTGVKPVPPLGTLTLVQGLLGEGWVMDGDTYLFTDAEIFGFIKQRRLVKKRPVPHHKLLFDITPGDYVVHIEHGVGKFAGITTLTTTGKQKEYLVLQYAEGDKLYVPTDQIDRVSRYIGAGDRSPVLSRLGTQEWSRTKQKAKEVAEELARELLALYATREVVPGHAFPPDTLWQQELEASFPYVETADQLVAVREVKSDLEKSRPMDRLVCGDVGYGKTEVAIRAAFKAVMDGRQVAVLVPTTVLAEQHYATFTERLKAFPLRIEVLSRFKSRKEQEAIIEDLKNGAVDIVIGTHRLVQKDVGFKDLGLLVIDEEQRFGVMHKEYLKKMRQEVAVLTLSATPIPRTLHMALVGVRDMSTISTPPDERLPIKTYVAEYDDRLVREAILRELERNGQVFFVHNRVQSIAIIAEKLRSLVPEARIVIAHGRMREDELESAMTEFARGRSDVLVCTTIIESGLDMPNVNTLIVNQADKLGLTQLYQLRGRVGRGANLAYAYFLYDKGKRIMPAAQKRLRTIYEATELGAGFNIAMKDLEIRGAGTLLGTRQSGYISAIGFNLYCRLLAEAVEEQKARLAGVREKKPPVLPAPSIDLPLSARIPDDYVSDVETRLSLYQRMAKLETVEAVAALAQELEDRFGPPSIAPKERRTGALPDEVRNLLYALKIKLLAAKAKLESIATEDGQIVLRVFQGMQFDRSKLAPLLKEGIRIGVTQLRIPVRKGWQGLLEEVVRRVGS